MFGRLTRLAIDLVAISTVLAGVRKFTGFAQVHVHHITILSSLSSSSAPRLRCSLPYPPLLTDVLISRAGQIQLASKIGHYATFSKRTLV